MDSCPQCRTPVAPSWAYCPKCATPLTDRTAFPPSTVEDESAAPRQRPLSPGLHQGLLSWPRLVIVAACLLVAGGLVAVVLTNRASTPPGPKGLSVALSQVETFFNARGTLATEWTQRDNVTTTAGCSPFCGDRRELSGSGAACEIQVIGPVSNVLGLILTCYPGQPASSANPTPVANEAARALLSATVERFAPWATAWSHHELEAALGGPGVNKVNAIHEDGTASVTLSSGGSYIGLIVRST
jgi:hypothetical protein